MYTMHTFFAKNEDDEEVSTFDVRFTNDTFQVDVSIVRPDTSEYVGTHQVTIHLDAVTRLRLIEALTDAVMRAQPIKATIPDSESLQRFIETGE